MLNVRGQGYNNGSNKKGKHQGVQKRLIKLKPKVSCNNIYLTLCNMEKSCVRATSFFGIVQSIYTLFSRSTKR